MSVQLPSPDAKYDRENEAQTRRTLEEALANANEQILQLLDRMKKAESRLTVGGL